MMSIYCSVCNKSKKEKENFLKEYCEVCPSKVENIMMIEELKKDELTKLGNRHKLKEFLEKYVDDDKYYDVILFDLNNLHTINRNYGYEAGDKYILEFVNILKKIFKKENTMIFRIGGDEFLVFSKMQISNLDEIKNYAIHSKEVWYPKEENFYNLLSKLDRELIDLKKKRINPIIRFFKKIVGCRY